MAITSVSVCSQSKVNDGPVSADPHDGHGLLIWLPFVGHGGATAPRVGPVGGPSQSRVSLDDTPLGPARLLAPVEAWSPILATPHLLFSFLESAEEVGLVSDSL